MKYMHTDPMAKDRILYIPPRGAGAKRLHEHILGRLIEMSNDGHFFVWGSLDEPGFEDRNVYVISPIWAYEQRFPEW
jgi:hypothetical protein